jgi:hypothetical protein
MKSRFNSIVSEVVSDYAGKHFASDNSGYSISQTVNSVTAGTTYNFSSWVNLTSDVFTFQLQVRWRDASNATISTTTIKTCNPSTTGWSQATASPLAPAGNDERAGACDRSLNAAIYVEDFEFKP